MEQLAHGTHDGGGSSASGDNNWKFIKSIKIMDNYIGN